MANRCPSISWCSLWNTREQANRIDQGSLSAVVVEVFMEKGKWINNKPIPRSSQSELSTTSSHLSDCHRGLLFEIGLNFFVGSHHHHRLREWLNNRIKRQRLPMQRLLEVGKDFTESHNNMWTLCSFARIVAEKAINSISTVWVGVSNKYVKLIPCWFNIEGKHRI